MQVSERRSNVPSTFAEAVEDARQSTFRSRSTRVLRGKEVVDGAAEVPRELPRIRKSYGRIALARNITHVAACGESPPGRDRHGLSLVLHWFAWRWARPATTGPNRRCGWRPRTCRGGRGASVLRATEPDSGGGRLRCVRRDVVRAVSMPRMGQTDGKARGESSSRRCARRSSATMGRPSLAPGRYFRLLLLGYFEGPGLGAGDRLAGGRFAESAGLSAPGAAGGPARPFDDLADAPAVERGDAPGGLHLGAAAARRRRAGAGQDGGHRRDDAGSQCGLAQHRAPRHGRGLHGVPGATGGSVGHRDADPRRVGAVRPVPQAEEDLERRLDPSA